MKSKLILPNVSGRYGAQYGRRNQLPDDPNSPIKLHMERLKWVDGDYDQGGVYWGRTWVPDPSVKTTWGTFKASVDVYCAYGDGVYVFVRATNRKLAKEEVREILPHAKFFS